jgi:hypothetical protein
MVDKTTWGDKVFSEYFDCSTLIIIINNHQGLVQYAQQWPIYQVDPVSPHRKNRIWRI